MWAWLKLFLWSVISAIVDKKRYFYTPTPLSINATQHKANLAFTPEIFIITQQNFLCEIHVLVKQLIHIKDSIFLLSLLETLNFKMDLKTFKNKKILKISVLSSN